MSKASAAVAVLVLATCAVTATVAGTSTATAVVGTTTATAQTSPRTSPQTSPQTSPRTSTVAAGTQAGQTAAGTARERAARPRYRYITLPTRPCATEDAPGPCVWDAGLRGNGYGASFWRDRHGHVNYLDYEWDWEAGWRPRYDRCHYDSSQPEPRACQYPFTYFRGWKRVSTAMSDALAEGEYGTERDWTRCIEHVGDTTFIVCPDGFAITS